MPEALYFPKLSLPFDSWTNSSLLFFDRICILAPGGARYHLDPRTTALVAEGLVKTVEVDRMDWDFTSDERMLGYHQRCG